jgi:phosphate transport system permease protein
MDTGQVEAPEAPTPAPSWAEAGRPPASLRRRRFIDRLARWVVSLGGIAIIASVCGIFVFIVWEVRPLLVGADAESRPAIPLVSSSRAIAAGVDEHETVGFAISAAGKLEYFALEKHAAPTAVPLAGAAGREIRSAHLPLGRAEMTLGTSDGYAIPLTLHFDVAFAGAGDKSTRTITPRIMEEPPVALDSAGQAIVSLSRQAGSQGTAVAAVTADGRLLYFSVIEEKSMTGKVTRSEERVDLSARLPGPASSLVMDHQLENLYVGTKSGHIVHFDLRTLAEPAFVESQPATIPAGTPVTALGLLIGDQSVVVGDAKGGVRVWFQVENKATEFGRSLRPAHEFPPQPGTITSIAPSGRDKGFVTADDKGSVFLRHATSEQTLATLQGPASSITCVALSPRATGLFAAHENGTMSRWAIHNPYPEISFRTLFGTVWYESYAAPDYVWQSTGGTDDYEPKLSMMPLVLGTLKGTFYALIIAIPLAILGALYTSLFMHPMLKSYVKPTVEVMAALPSVVLGFLAFLWLAPVMERIIPAIGLMFLALPVSCLAAMFLYRLLPGGLRHRHGEKLELLCIIPALLLAGWICLKLNSPLENLLFGGDFGQWVYTTLGLRFDQRNALVVGFAMGFAVIPIIFTISEDALSNVPRHLSSGSLALGATRWQTAVRVVLPAAGPGIFSAVMIGFGRVVGETMIVLMATGNTAIMDFNPFTGFRALSACIATEIAEAPHGGTLYRILFLGASLLFAATFLVNTAAEVVRQRMRRRYAQL